jgi:hypothetical protein
VHFDSPLSPARNKMKSSDFRKQMEKRRGEKKKIAAHSKIFLHWRYVCHMMTLFFFFARQETGKLPKKGTFFVTVISHLFPPSLSHTIRWTLCPMPAASVAGPHTFSLYRICMCHNRVPTSVISNIWLSATAKTCCCCCSPVCEKARGDIKCCCNGS